MKKIVLAGALLVLVGALMLPVIPQVVSATGTHYQQKCEMEISKNGPSQAATGDVIEYTLNFKNIGTSDCTGGGVHVMDELPSAIEYVSESHSSNVTGGYGGSAVYQASAHTMHWNAATLTPGESGWVKVKAKVKAKNSCGNFDFENKGKITAKELNNFQTWVVSNTVKTTVSNSCQVPVCTLSAAPNTFPMGGGNTTLTWTTDNADTVSIDQGVGSVALDGNQSALVTTSKTFKLTATGAGGTVTCEAPVTVANPSAPVCTLDVDPSSITKGSSARVDWTSQNVDHVVIVAVDNAGQTGVEDTNAGTGSKVVSPIVNTTYKGTFSGPGGTVTCEDSVTVTIPQPEDPVCDAFSVSPNTLTSAGNVTLTWNTTNTDAVSISNGVGSVDADGSRVVAVSQNTNFVLTATKGQKSVTCEAPVTISTQSPLTCDAFTASASQVGRGDNVTLTWNTTNANSVSINQGVGSVAVDGSQSVSISEDKTFTLTAIRGNDQVTCNVSVNVRSGGGGGGSSSPRCDEFKASDTKIKPGESVTLSWETRRGTKLSIEPDVYDTTDLKKVREGSVKVAPKKDTKYTLTVSKGSRKDTCTVSIDVSDITVVSTREPLTSISMTQIPYTGFDAGPLLTGFFYVLLGLWALAIAYVLVFERGAVFGISLQMLGLSGASRKGFASASAAPAAYDATIAPIAASAQATAPVSAFSAMPEENLTHLENLAFEYRVLMSNDALKFIAGLGNHLGASASVIKDVCIRATQKYPRENGWVVLGRKEVAELLGM